VFLIAALLGVAAFFLTWFLPEVPLRETTTATDPGEVYAMPEARSSREEIERALSLLASRDSWRRSLERLAAHADLALSAETCWLLCRISYIGPCTPERLSGRLHVPVARLTRPLMELSQAGLLASTPPAENGHAEQQARLALTGAGQQAHHRLVAAERAELDRLLHGWSSDQESDLAMLLTRMAEKILSDESADHKLIAARASTTA
jgi:DNA-binding MarR family transcriptional regulator